MALWLVQTNGGNTEDYRQIIAGLSAANARWCDIKVRPFTNIVHGLPADYRSQPSVVLGTVNLARWGKAKGLRGVWWNRNFDFAVQREHYGDHMLNADSTIHPFDAIPRYEGERFIRPVGDGKAFTGEVVAWEKLSAWQERVRYLDSHQLPIDLPVQVASVKRLFREYRFFVVAGQVVASSLASENNRIVRRALRGEDAYVLAFAQRMVGMWTPDEVFVIDIAIVEWSGDYKIIEINNANASGFYHCDVAAFARAVDALLV